MKVLAINSSPRHEGNTSILLREVLQEVAKESIATEIVNIGGKAYSGCRACGWCFGAGKGKMRCVVEDGMNEVIAKAVAADAIILGSPTYFADVNAEMKCFIDRAGYVTRANGSALSRKVGAGVVAVRRAAGMRTFESLNAFFLINGFVVPGSTYWNIGFGREVGEVAKDEEGMETMRNLGKNIAWLLQKLQG